MKLTQYLCYPSLDLFVFHLKEGLGENNSKILANHHVFWTNLPSEITVDLPTESRTRNPEFTRLLELTQGKKTYPLKVSQMKGFKIGGYYYPVLLNDTYGLLLDICVEEKQKPIGVRCFPELKEVIVERQGDLGKTWMISGYLPDSFANPQEIAAASYYYFTGKEWQDAKVNTGKFLGADIFEVWQSSPDWKSIENDDEERNTILIIIYPNQKMMDEAARFYDYWINLLCCRHKILWAYNQSRNYSEALQRQLSLLNETIEVINHAKLDLATLKKNLAVFSNYVIQLEQLEILNQALEVNLYNYRTWVSNISTRASQVGETNLKFLEELNEVVTQQYQKQIRQDYSSFKSGLQILASLRDTIKGMVEIEQAESDRRIENIIAAAGIGVGTASAAASASSALIKDFSQFYPIKVGKRLPIAEPLSNLIIVLFFSISLGLLTGWLSWKILQRDR